MRADLNPLGPVSNAIGGAFGGAVSASTTVVLDGLSRWVAKGAASLLGSLVTVLDRQTSPDLGARWFSGQYLTMTAVALLLALPLVFAAAITAVIRQDAGPLMRAVFVNLPLAGIGTAVAINLTVLALAATDGLCAMVSANTGTNTHALFDKLAQILDSGIPGAGGFGVVVVACLVAVGAFVLSLELIVRSAATYVAMLFLPVGLAGMIWPSTARWGRRVIELLTALILSKFVIVAVISLAVAALEGGASDQGLSGLLTGAALLLLACVSPFALLRMAPVVEAGALAHLEGAGRRVASAPGEAKAAASAARTRLHGLLDSSGTPGGDQSVAPSPGVENGPTRLGVEGNGLQSASTGPLPSFAAPGGEAAGAAGGEAIGTAGAATAGVGAAVAVPVAAAAVTAAGTAAAARHVTGRLEDGAAEAGNLGQ